MLPHSYPVSFQSPRCDAVRKLTYCSKVHIAVQLLHRTCLTLCKCWHLTLDKHSVQIPNECPQDVADTIKDCMKSVPEDRPTTREIFHRLRKCSKPRDSGGKGSTTYPGHGTGSSGGTGGSLPANQVSSVAGAPV
jgi:hypothetical protein